ncbi:hypothetical protein [Nocardia lasii]|uniref:Rho termination factor N-terminal domain-containing protein n=1 Tax=Nocardia lasii TaxID=1616107 RepID=A0ABW1JTK2_9NOCA
MADLDDLGALNVRFAEFLREVDPATARALIAGTMKFAAVPVDATVSDPPTRTAPVVHLPSSTPRAWEPDRVARELQEMTPGSQRSRYLNGSGLTVAALRQVATLLGISGYSRLAKADLVALLAGHPTDHGAGAFTPVPAEAVVDSASNGSAAPEATPAASRPATAANPDGPSIAAHLRATDTVDAGAAYLRAHNLDRADLLAVAAALQLTRVDRLSRADLEKRVLKQAITARRKFAGLRQW